MATRVGDYELGEELGSGGMGAVYRGRHVERGTEVAVKLLRVPSDQRAEAEARFQREVDLGRRVRHPNVVHTVDAGTTTLNGEHLQFLVMPYVRGETLRDLLAGGPLPEGICRHVLGQLASGLGALHALGIVHRDVKPENVIVTPDDHVVLVDLGVARAGESEDNVSRAGQFVGSVSYAPPEAFEARVNPVPAFDTWGLGVLLYEMATGVHPFEREGVEGTLRAIMHERPRPFSAHGIEPAPFIEALVRRLLSLDREVRPQDAQAVSALLSAGESGDWWQRDVDDASQGNPWTPLLDLRLPFVGRRDEREALATSLASESGRVVLVLGDPGSGRTRLVHEVLDAERTLECAYVGGGGEGARGWLFRLLRDGFGADGLGDALAEAAGSEQLGARCLDALDPARGTAARDLGRDLLLGVGIDSLRLLAQRRPFVMWFDDIEAAPIDVRLQVREIARAVPKIGASVVITSRPEALPAELRVVGEWGHARRIDLTALDASAVREFVQMRYGSEHIAEDLAELARTRSGGSPQVLLSFLDRLDAEGYLQRHPDGRWSIARRREEIERLPVPATAEGVWRSRIRALAAEDREVLDVAACIGLSFDAELVCAVLGRTPLDVLRRLARLERGPRLVRSAGARFGFAVQLVRDLILEEMPEPLREAYHRALAAHLEGVLGEPGDVDGEGSLLLCEQWMQGGNLARAFPHALAAARHLSDLGAPEHAIRLHEQFLESDHDFELATIGELVMERTLAGLEAGSPPDPDLLERWLVRAEADGNPVGQAYIHHALGHRLAREGRFAESETHLRRAVDLARSSGDPQVRVRAIQALAQVLVYLGQHEFGLEVLDEALELVSQHDDLSSSAAVLLVTKSAHRSSHGRFDLSLPLIEQALASARAHGRTVMEAETLRIMGAIYDRLGRWADAEAVTRESIALARTCRDRANLVSGIANRAEFLVALGRYGEAWSEATAALDIARDLALLRNRVMAWYAVAMSGALFGRHEEAWRLGEGLEAELRDTPDATLRTLWSLGAAKVAANAEDWGRCRALAEKAVEILGAEASGALPCRARLVAGRAAWLDGDRDAALVHFRAGWELGRVMETELCWGLLNGAWLAPHDADVPAEYARIRAEWWERLDMPTKMELAWLAREHDDPAADVTPVAELLDSVRQPLSPEGRSLLTEGHWLHRRIAAH